MRSDYLVGTLLSLSRYRVWVIRALWAEVFDLGLPKYHLSPFWSAMQIIPGATLLELVGNDPLAAIRDPAVLERGLPFWEATALAPVNELSALCFPFGSVAREHGDQGGRRAAKRFSSGSCARMYG